MISAIALICSLNNPSYCRTISGAEIFPTVEMCMEDRVNAEGFALRNNFVLISFHCFNWGEAA